MTDIYPQDRVSLAGTFMDWLQNADGLSEEQELATAVRVAIGTDSLAAIDDPLPDLDSEDRRGWWGDLDAEEIWSGWPIGCKNWLLFRAKIADPYSWEGATLVRAKAYTRQALQPFIDLNICSRIDVEAIRSGRDQISVSVSIYRGPKLLIELRFQSLWDEVGRDYIPVGSKDRYVTGQPLNP
jgi:phage gp46-like protein